MNDHRSPERIEWDELNQTPQNLIDLWNEGYEFHDTHYPDEGPSTPVSEAIQHARFTVLEFHTEADAYWAGYEAAANDSIARGVRQPEPITEEDKVWAMGEVLRFMKGDRK